MRVFLFFLWFLGFGIGVPALVLGLIKRTAQPKYLLDDHSLRTSGGRFEDPAAAFGDTKLPPGDLRPMFPEAEAAAFGAYADGTRLLLFKFAGAEAGNRTVRRYYAQSVVGKPRDVGGPGDASVLTLSSGEAGWIVRRDPYAFVAVGPDEAAARRRFESVRGITRNPDRRLGNKIDEEYKLHTLGLVLLWCVPVGLLFCRMAGWAGTVTPPPHAPAVAERTLRAALLAVNEQDVPFTVSESTGRPDEVVVDWRYADAKWFDLMRVHGMRKAYRLVLRLDDAGKTVRAREYETSLDYSAGRGGPAAASLNWRGNVGIVFFQYQHERVFGLQVRDGRLTADPSYSYTFDLGELKQPVIRAVVESGWEYRPVLTFFRPVGG